MATPRHHTPRDPAYPTRAPAVAVIAQAKGAPLLVWQRKALDVALEFDPRTGLYRYGVVVVTVQRQAGKTKMEGDIADHRCITLPRARCWITMQDGKTVDQWMRQEHFMNLAAATAFGVPGTPGCRYKLSKRAGSVGVEWPSRGSSFLSFAPTRNALHSKQSDLVIVDEAWSFTGDQGADLRQAIRPTMNTRPGSQLWILSTEGDDLSEYLASYIDLGVASLTRPDSRVCFIDYGIPEDADAEDLDVIAEHHPAYGTPLLTRASLEAAREDFAGDSAGWARAYGNRRTRSRAAAFPPGSWDACSSTRPATIPPVRSLGFDMTPAGDRAALATAWRLDEDLLYAELVDVITDPGRDLPDLLAAAARAARAPIDYDPVSLGTVDVIEALERNHPDVTVRRLTTAQVGAATLNLTRLVAGRRFRHPDQPDLNAATEVATKRSLGDGGSAWGRKTSTGSIAELCAITWASRAADNLPDHTPPIF